jgi:chitinase
MMLLISSLLLLLPLVSNVCAESIVAGYLPDYRSYVNINNTAALLTDLILFSIEPNGDDESAGSLKGQCCLDASHYKRAREARKHRAQRGSSPLKLWVSIGGAGRSSGFKKILASPSNQAKFVRNMVNTCKEEHMDGIDLDWEGILNQNDYSAYMDFIVVVANALHKENLLLSVTTRQRLPPVVIEHIDRINFMAYDLLLNNGPKHHASYTVVTDIVANWLAVGYPSKKIILGIPGYGRHKNNPSVIKTYAELVDSGLNDSSLSEWKGIMFDSPKQIRRKIDFVRRNLLGGVFLWELGHDKQLDVAPHGVLLEVLSEIQDIPDEL